MRHFYITTEYIQNTKWKNPIYEMRHFYTTTENIQNTKWPKWQREMSNLRNGLVVFRKYPIYEMTCKYPIYEMDEMDTVVKSRKLSSTWESRQLWSRQFDSKCDATLWYWSPSHVLINPLTWSLLVEDCDFQKCHNLFLKLLASNLLQCLDIMFLNDLSLKNIAWPANWVILELV